MTRFLNKEKELLMNTEFEVLIVGDEESAMFGVGGC